VVGDGRWIALEHELWAWATRDEAAGAHLARRYRAAWEGVEVGFGPGTGPPVIGLLLGLEMIRRVDPTAVTEASAVAALRAIVSAGAGVADGHDHHDRDRDREGQSE
jgi:hypothetical protein